jgi:hypothetical protein
MTWVKKKKKRAGVKGDTETEVPTDVLKGILLDS